MNQLIQLLKNRKFLFGFAIFMGTLFLAIFAPFLADKKDALTIGLFDTALPPNLTHILGTNSYGQDAFARLVFGLRSSLYVGLAAAIIATTFGTAIGLISGYKGGWIDDVLTAISNLFTVLPSFLIIILVSAILEKRSLTLVAVIIGSITWSWTARSVRAQASSLRDREHVSLAKLNGFGTISIIIRQILPYIASYIFMAFIIQMATGILNEAAISMIGLGPYDTVTLGMILNDAQKQEAILNGSWWVFIPATLLITMLQFSLYIMNSSMESIFNPRLRVKKEGK
jgi:peptide/nickel transport system permease protein